MWRAPRQAYTAEFKQQAVARARAQSVFATARELGLAEQTLRNWVKAAEGGTLVRPGSKPVTPEEMALSRERARREREHILRRQVRKPSSSGDTAGAPFRGL